MPNKDRTAATAIERLFDVTVNITEEWFQSYVSELTKRAGVTEDIDCDVRMAPDLQTKVAFRSRKAWTDYILEHWKGVAQSSISQYGGMVRRAFCNHQRHHVAITLEADDVLEIERTFQLLCGALSLRPSPQNPYKYRRSSLEFEIGNWRPDSFVLGVKNVAEILGPNPEVADAWAKSFEGEIEKLTPFFDLKSFGEGIGTRASRFGEITVRMQARSIGVGVSVTSDHRKLRIRTSLPPDTVDKFITAWPDDLKLKQIKAADTGAEVGGRAPASSEKAWLKYGVVPRQNHDRL